MPETSKALYVVSSKPYIYYGMELRLPRSRVRPPLKSKKPWATYAYEL